MLLSTFSQLVATKVAKSWECAGTGSTIYPHARPVRQINYLCMGYHSEVELRRRAGSEPKKSDKAGAVAKFNTMPTEHSALNITGTRASV